jgi:hypothetical protein
MIESERTALRVGKAGRLTELMKPHNDTPAPIHPPLPPARASMASILEEMGEIVKAIINNRLS